MRHVILFFFFFAVGNAEAQTQLPHTFQAGQPARASEVNENFDTLAVSIDGGSADIQQLQLDNATMQETIDSLTEQLADVTKILNQPRQRVQTTLDVQLADGEEFACVMWSPESDALFNLDQISGDVSIPVAGDQRGSVLVRTLPDPGISPFARHYFSLTATGQVRGEIAQYLFNAQPKIYHDPTLGPLQICLERGDAPSNVSGTAFGSITLSGSQESSLESP
jgi:hypothetical protein